MYIIRPELLTMEGFDQSCLWILMKCFAMRASNTDKFSFPSYQTIADDCGWSRRKSIDMVAKLIELGLIRKEQRKADNGDRTSNGYYLETDLIFVVQGLKSDIVKLEELPSAKNDLPLVQNLHHPSAKNDPVTRASTELTTSSKKDIEIFSKNPESPPEPKTQPDKKTQLKSIIQNPTFQNSLDRFDLSPDELDYTLDEVLIKNPEIEPSLLAQKVFGFAPYSKMNYQKFKKAQELATKTNELKEQRIQDYHDKKMENIAKIGDPPPWLRAKEKENYYQQQVSKHQKIKEEEPSWAGNSILTNPMYWQD